MYLSALSANIFAMDDDENYVTSQTDSAKKRENPSRSMLNDSTVKIWPSLWRSSGRRGDINFLQRLAVISRLDNGKTLLHIAMALDAHNAGVLGHKVECVSDLIINGAAKIGALDNEGNTPLHLWVNRSNSNGSVVSAEEACKVGHVLNTLKPINFDLIRNHVGNTPMHIVCMTGLENINLFNLFVELGYDFQLLGSLNRSILHRLALASPCPKNEEIVARLCDLFKDDFYSNFRDQISNVVNQKDSKGYTALHYVCKGWKPNGKKSYSFNLPLFNLLVSILGCNLNIQDNDDHTPLYYANQRVKTKKGAMAKFMHAKLKQAGAI